MHEIAEVAIKFDAALRNSLRHHLTSFNPRVTNEMRNAMKNMREWTPWSMTESFSSMTKYREVNRGLKVGPEGLEPPTRRL
jgi:hypothetical protein